MSATAHPGEPPQIRLLASLTDGLREREDGSTYGPASPPEDEASIHEDHSQESARDGRLAASLNGRPRAATLAEQPTAVLLVRIARLEAAMSAALSLLRRCIVDCEPPTREALAAEAGFALGMSREAAMEELDEVAQIVGVSSLR